jgi:D-amino peptidase
MNVYILSDMEGTAGISIWDQVLDNQPKYEQSRQWMTEEINAAAEGAFAIGAKLVVVNDDHLNAHNLDLNLLNPRIEYLMGYGKNAWTELDDSFDVVLLVGAHAKAGTPEANLRHTWSPQNWADLRINGRSVGEIGLVAAGAGERGVPCTFVSGDDKACKEASELVPGIIQAQVKRGLSWQVARSLSLKFARNLIREKTKEACRVSDKIKPLHLAEESVDIEILLLAEDHGPLYASSLNLQDLMNKPIVRKRGFGANVPEALEIALSAPAEPVK